MSALQCDLCEDGLGIVVMLHVHRCLFQIHHLVTAELAREITLCGRGREPQALQQQGGVVGHDRVEEAGGESQALHGHQQDGLHGVVLVWPLDHVPGSPALDKLVGLWEEGQSQRELGIQSSSLAANPFWLS